MTDVKLTLYYNSASGCSNSVRFFLKYHNITCIEEKVVDLMAGEQYSEEYLKINPYHSVPVLNDHTNDVVLTESSAILLYLADLFQVHGDYGIPAEIGQRGKVLNFMARHPYAIRTPFLQTFSTFYKAFFDDDKEALDPAAIQQGIEQSKSTHFPILEMILKENGGYLTGRPTLADIYYVTDLARYLSRGDGMYAYNFEEFPAIAAWIQAVREAVFDDDMQDGTFAMLGYAREKLDSLFCVALPRPEAPASDKL